MNEWMQNSRAGIMIGGAAIVVAAIMIMISGCSLDRVIKVDVPRGVRTALQLPARIALRDADITFEQWRDTVRTDTQRFADNIEDAKWVSSFVASTVDTTIGWAEGPLATMPGGALLLSGLTGVAGLFMRQPGWAKEMRDEKEGSHKAGARQALATLASSYVTNGAQTHNTEASPTATPTPLVITRTSTSRDNQNFHYPSYVRGRCPSTCFSSCFCNYCRARWSSTRVVITRRRPVLIRRG